MTLDCSEKYVSWCSLTVKASKYARYDARSCPISTNFPNEVGHQVAARRQSQGLWGSRNDGVITAAARPLSQHRRRRFVGCGRFAPKKGRRGAVSKFIKHERSWSMGSFRASDARKVMVCGGPPTSRFFERPWFMGPPGKDPAQSVHVAYTVQLPNYE